MAGLQPRPEPVTLKRALTILLAHKTADQSHETARVKAIEAVEQAFDARENACFAARFPANIRG